MKYQYVTQKIDLLVTSNIVNYI